MYTAGSSILVSWTDDTHRPSLQDMGLTQIDLYAGNVTYVNTLARGVLPTVRRQMVHLPSDLPFTIADYTLRFTTTIPPMTVYSAEFIISSASAPSIVPQSLGRQALPTITVTRTAVVAPTFRQIVTQVVTLTQLPVGLAQPALVSPGSGPPVPEITFIQVGTAQDSITVAAAEDIQEGSITVRTFPIFISRLASPSLSSSQSNSSSDPSLTATNTTSFSTSSDSSAIISTSVAKPSTIEASQSSGARQSSAWAGLLAFFLAIVYAAL